MNRMTTLMAAIATSLLSVQAQAAGDSAGPVDVQALAAPLCRLPR